MRLAVGERVHEYRVHVIRQRLGIGNPAAVGRPARIERVAEAVDRHFDRFGVARLEIHYPKLVFLIGEKHLFAIRRPGKLVVIGVVLAERDPARRAGAVLGADVEIVFAGRVGEIRDRLAVRRPRHTSVHGARAVRQVDDAAVLGGHGENIAVRRERRAHAVRRDRRIRNLLGHVNKVRTALREIPATVTGTAVLLPVAKS